jgi:preprotein translocase subunit SecD
VKAQARGLLVLPLGVVLLPSVGRLEWQPDPQRSASPTEAFELRLAFPESAPGRDRFVVPQATPKKHIYVAREAVVTLRDVREISLSLEPVARGLTTRFGDAGRDRLAAATRHNVGNHFALFVNESLLSILYITSAILDGSALLYGHFSDPELEDLERQLRQALAKRGRAP